MAGMKAWVVGGTSGIGEATVIALRNLGWTSLATGPLDCDVRNYPQLEGFVKQQGPFGAVVYSAGVNKLQWIKDLKVEDMGNLFEVNVFGLQNVFRALLNSQEDYPTRICVVTSDAAVRPMRGSLNYCASKAAMEMMVKVAARELAHLDWRVNAVAPGMTAPTNMQTQLDREIPKFRGWTEEEAFEYEFKANPLLRRAHTTEVADMISQVLQMPDYVTGATFTINGGR
jgi:NAD(P)-dependent dehydrogenase (short-subunit alcohol dehydrogenase family)